MRWNRIRDLLSHRAHSPSYDFEGKEILVVVLDRADAFAFAGATTDSQRQEILDRSEVYVDGKPFGLALGQRGSVCGRDARPIFFAPRWVITHCWRLRGTRQLEFQACESGSLAARIETPDSASNCRAPGSGGASRSTNSRDRSFDACNSLRWYSGNAGCSRFRSSSVTISSSARRPC